ncbi:MAG: type II toxin-antitoxin system RelE/ParE family toxin [Rhizobiales bacterium]|nr:type II toxin-antitoxin system RelE/ParE family toxin [Hyphomicrobiales bacterium]
MIISFRHRGLKKFFLLGKAGFINPAYISKVSDILTKLNDAEIIEDMDVITFRLHPLSGNKKDRWSVTVRSNWRITFSFENGKAYNVDLEDYH